jgi:hypothetical protein
MTAYEKYFGSVEKVVETMSAIPDMMILCPSDFGMIDEGGKHECGSSLCTECWKRALERKVKDA